MSVRWGILGAGNIARKFAAGLAGADGAELVAVASRSQEKSDTFGDEFNIPTRHDSYDALAGDGNVDAVYVATPHTFHRDHTHLCLDGGKAVLCEKPIAVNARDAQVMVDKARETGCFLMEAMWTRFLPATVKVREWIAEGRIGEVRNLTADFGFRAGVNPEGRLFSKDLAGGALLDVGIYPIAYAAMLFGTAPDAIVTSANLGETGVDEENSSILHYPSGAIAVCQSAVRLNTPHTAIINGTEGRIEVPGFWSGTKATLSVQGQEPEVFEEPHRVNGYEYEAMEVGRCLEAGAIESETMGHDESVAIMKILDQIRAEWGLTYPADAE
ncbi:MAG: Gfo/Idh/MocA family protein [Planctomycetota bacterium]|jgi:predicted dehydrogenase